MISLKFARILGAGVLGGMLITIPPATPSVSAPVKSSVCRTLEKITTFRNCSGAVTYTVKLTLAPKRISFHVRFQNRGPGTVFFLANWPPVVAQNAAEASISIALGEPALQASALPQMVKVRPGAVVERNVNVPIRLELTQVKFVYFTLFFATDDPGFFEHLAKDCGGHQNFWYTDSYRDQVRYADLVLSDTIEFPLQGHLSEKAGAGSTGSRPGK